MKTLKILSISILAVFVSSCGTTKTLKQDNEQLSNQVAVLEKENKELKNSISLAIQPVLQDIQDLEDMLANMEKYKRNLTKQNLDKADKQIDKINLSAPIIKGLLPEASKQQFRGQIERYKTLYQDFSQR